MSLHATFVSEPTWCKDCFKFLQGTFMEGKFAADFSTVLVSGCAVAGKYKSSSEYELEEGDVIAAVDDALKRKKILCHAVRIAIMPEMGPAHTLLLAPLVGKDTGSVYVGIERPPVNV